MFRSMIMNIQQTYVPKYFEYPIAYNSMTTGENGTVPGSTQECVGKHTKLTDRQTDGDGDSKTDVYRRYK